MLVSFNSLWLPTIKNIDIKSHEWPWCDDRWAEELPKNITKMWMDPEVPRGFSCYRFMGFKDLISELDGNIIHISKLAVRPNFRGKGIGSSLLENIIVTGRIQKVKALVILVHEENDLGIKWIGKRGFKAHSVRLGAYPDERDGYSFILDLGIYPSTRKESP